MTSVPAARRRNCRMGGAKGHGWRLRDLAGRAPAGAGRGREDVRWCGREDSNFHGVSPTSTSTLRVYQFRHDRMPATARAMPSDRGDVANAACRIQGVPDEHWPHGRPAGSPSGAMSVGRALSRGAGRHGGAGRRDPRRRRAASWSGCSSIRRSTPPAPAPAPSDLLMPDRFPVFTDRPRRPVHLSRAGPAGRLCDARPQARAGRTCAPTSGELEEWLIRTLWPLQRRRRAARGPGRHLGRRKARGTRGQDRGDRRPGAPLGELSRRRPQRRPRPRAFRRHRALRHRGTSA